MVSTGPLPARIVLTGAPSSGKSSALEHLSMLGRSEVAVVPEAAVVLLSGGFPAPGHDALAQIKEFQNAILDLQPRLEQIIALKNPTARFLVCDRGRLDGAGFWPPGPDDFLRTFAIDLPTELARADLVLFLELPDSKFFGGVKQSRFHNYEQSKLSESKLAGVWGGHPKFLRVPAYEKFSEKLELIERLIVEFLNVNCA